MILRHLANGRALVDREALALETGLSPETIRVKLRPVDYDRSTHRALYDHDTAREGLAGVVPWPAMRGPRKRRSA